VRTLTDAARIINEKNVSVLLFPEGGRTPDGHLQEFKEGASFVGLKASVPVLPVAIRGARPILPMGNMLVRTGQVEMRIGKPIPTAHLTVKSRASLTAEMRDQIEQMLHSHSTEPEPAKQRA
jgi:1-acyl-sn-glycerol-3-phosphate acyltransferase